MTLTTLKTMARFTGKARQHAIKYVKKQYMLYKAHKGVYTNSSVRFVQPISKTLRVSENVVAGLCKGAAIPMTGTNPTYDTFKDSTIRSWAAAQFRSGDCVASVMDLLKAKKIRNLPKYGGLDTFRRNTVFGIDKHHTPSGTSKLVNHQPRFAGKTETGGLGKRSNKPVQAVTHRYNLHISTLSRMIGISETQVTKIFTSAQIEHKTPSYLVALRREKTSKRKTRR
jgi:hypothetical protein